MSINWNEIRKEYAPRMKYPDFWKPNSEYGEQEMILMPPIRLIRGRYGTRIAVTIAIEQSNDYDFFTWSIPNSITSEILDQLEHIDKEQAMYKITIGWVGSGKFRRYKLIKRPQQIFDKNKIVEIGSKFIDSFKAFADHYGFVIVTAWENLNRGDEK